MGWDEDDAACDNGDIILHIVTMDRDMVPVWCDGDIGDKSVLISILARSKKAESEPLTKVVHSHRRRGLSGDVASGGWR